MYFATLLRRNGDNGEALTSFDRNTFQEEEGMLLMEVTLPAREKSKVYQLPLISRQFHLSSCSSCNHMQVMVWTLFMYGHSISNHSKDVVPSVLAEG